MTGLQIVEQLSGTDGMPAIVVFDFAEASTEINLSAQLAAGAPAYAIHRVDVVSDLTETPARVAFDELSTGYAKLIEQIPTTVTLAAFCSAAALAIAVARDLGREMTTVLVQPTWIDDHELRKAVDAIYERLGAPPTNESLPIGSAEEIMPELRAHLVRLLTTQDVPDEDQELVVSALAQRYGAWMTYLLDVHDLRAPLPRGQVAVLTVAEDRRGGAPGWPSDAVITEFLPATAFTSRSPVLAETVARLARR